MKKLLTVSTLLLVSLLPMKGDDAVETFKIAPIGRVLLDGGAFVTPVQEFQRPGVVAADVSVGTVMTLGRSDVRIDVGFNFKDIGFRDIFYRYTFDDKMFVKVGHFHQPYGLQSATTNTFKVSMEQPLVNKVLNEDRQLGAMFEYADSMTFAALSVHADTKSALGRLSLTDGRISEGYGVQTRLAVHPVYSSGRLVQVGISGAFTIPQKTLTNGVESRTFTYSAPFPTRIFNATALSAEVTDARNSWSFSPELLLAFGPVAFESQYYFRQVNHLSSSGLRPYRSYGAYGIIRGLILGGDYRYSPSTGALINPGKGSLELVGMYNYCNLNDGRNILEITNNGDMTNATEFRDGIFGGRAQGFSATMNYYLNRFTIIRLQFSHTYAWGSSFAPRGRQLNAIQARLQVNF